MHGHLAGVEQFGSSEDVGAKVNRAQRRALSRKAAQLAEQRTRFYALRLKSSADDEGGHVVHRFKRAFCHDRHAV